MFLYGQPIFSYDKAYFIARRFFSPIDPTVLHIHRLIENTPPRSTETPT